MVVLVESDGIFLKYVRLNKHSFHSLFYPVIYTLSPLSVFSGCVVAAEESLNL